MFNVFLINPTFIKFEIIRFKSNSSNFKYFMGLFALKFISIFFTFIVGMKGCQFDFASIFFISASKICSAETLISHSREVL